MLAGAGATVEMAPGVDSPINGSGVTSGIVVSGGAGASVGGGTRRFSSAIRRYNCQPAPVIERTKFLVQSIYGIEQEPAQLDTGHTRQFIFSRN